ncbi:hypothetical protein LSM04_007081 [Trypanosoma melophagium]|uniref:uncharacterized protein n=1 Tax=Trypanosoma melophagium TaxID=715481 RepID=UPI00351A13A3|nr:hypothetical protein LSM04_007081 [Trypanosoma melophagium]
MWSVIRRLQGVSPDDGDIPAETRLEHNQRCIMMHEMRPYPHPLDPNIFTRPYGELEYEKVRVWMLNDDVSRRIQAINHLLELYVMQRENAIRSLKYGFLELLLSTLHHDEEEEMRCKAADALALLLREPKALEFLLAMDDEKGTLRELLTTLDDPSSEVVVRAVRVLMGCRAAYNGYEAITRLVRYGLVERCVRLLEPAGRADKVAAAGCGGLAAALLVKEAFVRVVRAGGVGAATAVLAAPQPDPLAVAEAADALTLTAAYRLGKTAAVDAHTLAALRPHMRNENLRVRTSITAAVAQLTIYEPGKRQAVDEEIPAVLLALLMQEEERDVLVNVVKAIVNIAELPAGRRQLLAAKERLQFIASEADDYQPLTSSVAEALSQLERKC